MNMCDLAIDSNMCLNELETLLHKLGKFLMVYNKPKDAKILRKLFEVIDKAKSENLDIDEKSMIPCSF